MRPEKELLQNPKKNAATVRLNAAQTKVTHGQQIQTANRRIVIAERHAASTNEFLTLTPPTPTTASAFLDIPAEGENPCCPGETYPENGSCRCESDNACCKNDTYPTNKKCICNPDTTCCDEAPFF